MRKLIIDTDVGSDDAVAILMALCDPSVEVLAITTVSGNVPMKTATANCLQTCEIAGVCPPVYEGADRPLMRQPVHAENVHGNDGMGDLGLIHPVTKAVAGVHAADAILTLVRQYPGEIELAVIGPATNVALAILKEPETMRQLKCIWTMGTGGFGPGNTSPVAEFNVFADAEAYRIMLSCGVPVYVGGFDLCTYENAWHKEDMDALLESGHRVARFAVECNSGLVNYFITHFGQHIAHIADAVTMACLLWDDVYTELVPCTAHVCIEDPATYGQVIFYSPSGLRIMQGFGASPNPQDPTDCYVVAGIHTARYKERLYRVLTGNCGE